MPKQSSLIRPCLCGLHGTLPQLLQSFTLLFFHRRFERAILLPVIFQFSRIFPITHGKSCKVRCTKRGGFGNSWSHNHAIENVALELHELVVDRCATVNTNFFDWKPSIG